MKTEMETLSDPNSKARSFLGALCTVGLAQNMSPREAVAYTTARVFNYSSKQQAQLSQIAAQEKVDSFIYEVIDKYKQVDNTNKQEEEEEYFDE